MSSRLYWVVHFLGYKLINVCFLVSQFYFWEVFVFCRERRGITLASKCLVAQPPKPETDIFDQSILVLKKWQVWKRQNETAYLLSVALHDVVDLLELVGEPLLAGELVLLQGEDQLLVVLHSIPGDDKDDDRQEESGWMVAWEILVSLESARCRSSLGHLTSWESDEGLRMLMKGIFPNFARNTFLADFVQLVVSSVWMVLMIIMVLVLGLMMMITNPIMKFKFKR